MTTALLVALAKKKAGFPWVQAPHEGLLISGIEHDNSMEEGQICIIFDSGKARHMGTISLNQEAQAIELRCPEKWDTMIIKIELNAGNS